MTHTRRLWPTLRKSFGPFGQTLLETFGAIVLGIIGFIAICALANAYDEHVRPVVSSIAACPIHVTTHSPDGYPVSDYCWHLGIGK